MSGLAVTSTSALPLCDAHVPSSATHARYRIDAAGVPGSDRACAPGMSNRGVGDTSKRPSASATRIGAPVKSSDDGSRAPRLPLASC
jgi:hypothetical protein|eukprot:30904-Pelagococcus_subviridis.AAC.1